MELSTNYEKENLHKHPVYGHRTLGQKLADDLTKYAGSWGFIIIFLFIIIAWISLNAFILLEKPYDPYPFILLNLGLSMVAAIQAPIILMSQNRQAERDRKKAELDYQVNKKAEKEIEDMQKDLHEIKELLRKR